MTVLENFWDGVLQLCGHDKMNACLWGPTVFMFVWFWMVSSIYMVFDLFSWPKWVLKYKSQTTENVPLAPHKAWQLVKTVVINQTIMSVPCTYLMLHLGDRMGATWKTEDLPTLGRFVRDIIGTLIILEIGFYTAHRSFHWPPLYKRFHKKHHEYTAPVGAASVYAHPLEYIICNHLVVMAGPTLMGAHLFTASVWYMGALFSTIATHSGYHLPFMPSNEFHDFHHLKFNYNYGSLGVLDSILGTDSLFRKMVHSKRHRIVGIGFPGLKPASERFPDPPKGKELNGSYNGVNGIKRE